MRFSEQGTFTFGTITDLGWIMWLCADRPGHVQPGKRGEPRRREPPVEPSPVAGTAVMFTLFLVAAVLSLVNLTSGDLDPASAALWLIVLLAVLARQILLIVDNEQAAPGPGTPRRRAHPAAEPGVAAE